MLQAITNDVSTGKKNSDNGNRWPKPQAIELSQTPDAHVCGITLMPLRKHLSHLTAGKYQA